jgi:hypothetical protein
MLRSPVQTDSVLTLATLDSAEDLAVHWAAIPEIQTLNKMADNTLEIMGCKLIWIIYYNHIDPLHLMQIE